MSSTNLVRDNELSNVPEVPESINLLAMSLNDSSPDLLSPAEFDILKDENANADVPVDVGCSIGEKKVVLEDPSKEVDHQVDVICDHLARLKMHENKSPTSSTEDLTGMVGKKGNHEGLANRIAQITEVAITKAQDLELCPKCKRSFAAGPLKRHELICTGESETPNENL